MNLHLRIPPLSVTLLAGVLGWFGARAFPGLIVPFPGRLWLTAELALLGLFCAGLGVASFRRFRTTVNPLRPAAATALVTSGIYRFTRNPMYLGFLLLLLAELAWFANPVAWLAAPAFVLYLDRFQIEPEEQALRARFGPEYLLYAARVRRWI